MSSIWKATPTFYSRKACRQVRLILGLSCFVCSLAKVIIVLCPLAKVTLLPHVQQAPVQPPPCALWESKFIAFAKLSLETDFPTVGSIELFGLYEPYLEFSGGSVAQFNLLLSNFDFFKYNKYLSVHIAICLFQ